MVISSAMMVQAGRVEMNIMRSSLALLMRVLIFAIVVWCFSASGADAKKSKYSPPNAAMVIDGYTGKVLYSSNADKLRYPASITKVMTLYLLFDQIRKGHMTFESKLKVSAKAASRPPSKLGLKPGSTISVHDAVYALVTKSANDVAAVVAENIAGSESAFARMMTQKARAMGMSKTTYLNASGLPNSKQVTTARDLITLGRRIRTDFPKLSKVFNTRYFKYGKRKFRNHNKLLFSYSGMEGLKTGFTRASGFNLLAACRRKGKYLIAVVLGGRSGRARNARMKKLLDGSWQKAVTLNDFKKHKPIAIAGIVKSEHMPERNPAFHDIEPEPSGREQLKIALAGAGDTGDATARQHPNAVAWFVAPPNIVASNSVPKLAVEKRSEPRTSPKQITSDGSPPGPYNIQVGSFLSPKLARNHLVAVSQKATKMLRGHDGHTVPGEVRGKAYYRARYSKFSQSDATSTCRALKKLRIDCLVVRVE